MPKTKGLELILKTKLDEDGWLALIEERRLSMKPHLNSVTLEELGQIRCLNDEGSSNSRHAEGDGAEITGEEGLSSRTQGIFGIQPSDAIQRLYKEPSPNRG